MNPDGALNAACREIFELIIEALGKTQDDYELTN